MAPVSWKSKLVSKFVNYKGDWLRQNRGSLMTVSALIVTITFQPAIAPPGGVWQNHTYYDDDQGNTYLPPHPHPTNTNFDFDCPSGSACHAGTAILAYANPIFSLFIVFDTVSFMASLAVMFLLIIGFPQENKLSMWILTITVCISISSLGFTFLLGMMCVLPSDSRGPLNTGDVALSSIFSWFSLVGIGTIIVAVLVLRQVVTYCIQRFSGVERMNTQQTTQEEMLDRSTEAV